MKYNFDELIDRSNNNSTKYEETVNVYGTHDVSPLWIADMDFKTAQPIIDALHERVEQGIFGYTHRPDEFFLAVKEWQEKRNAYSPDVEHMAFAPGVIPGIRTMIQAISQPEDGFIIQEPVYFPFRHIIEGTGRKVIVNPLKCEKGRYLMDYEDFEEKAKCGAKFFVLCNPHNPVGRVWTKEELKKIGDTCLKYDIQIISDEIHGDLILNDNKHTVMAAVSPEIAAITTVCTAPSKTFNLAGLQSSTIIFNSMDNRNKYQDLLTQKDMSRNNCFSIVSTIAACKYGDEWLDQLRVYISENMSFVHNYLKENIPVLSMEIPEGTYLGWLDARGLGMTDEELLRFTVDKAGVAFGVGKSFGIGGSGFLRVNCATQRSVLEKAFSQLKIAVYEYELNK